MSNSGIFHENPPYFKFFSYFFSLNKVSYSLYNNFSIFLLLLTKIIKKSF